MKRIISSLIILAMSVTMLIGCGNSSGTGSKSDTSSSKAVSSSGASEATQTVASAEKVNLKLFHGKQEAKDTFDQIIKSFNQKYPNITVEQELVTNEPSSVLKARLATGEIPDIFSCGTEVMDIAKGGFLTELTNEAFLKNILPDTLKSRTFTDTDGKIWAMPIDGSCIGIFYNKKMFADNGLTAPQTLTELKKVCETFKNKNIPAFALGFKDSWTIKMASVSAFSPAVYGSNLTWDDDKNSGKATFASTEGWKTSFDILKMIYTYGNTKTAFDTDYNGACSMFAQGKAAMMAQGLWALEPIRKITADLDIGIMGVPVSENPADTKLHQFPDFSLSISSKSKHIEEAKKFLEFMSTKEAGEIWSNTAKLFSAVQGVNSNFDPVAADVTKLIQENKICIQADRGWPTPFQSEFEKVLPQFLLGKKDLAATLTSLDNSWDKAKTVSETSN